MSYTKQGFKSKEKLYASQLNAMDVQIEQNANDVTQLLQQNKEVETQLTTHSTRILALEEDSIKKNPSAIINVGELPTENINENSFYRLMNAQFIFNKLIQSSWICRCVDNLPENPEPVSRDNENVYAYYNMQDGITYGYVDDFVSASANGSVPIGWYTLEQLAPSFGLTWGGVITDIDNDLEDDTMRVLLNYDFYIYKNEWIKTVFAYEKMPKLDITWDGDMTDRIVMDMSSLGYESGIYFVKVSDKVLTANELIGSYMAITAFDDYTDGSTIEEEHIDTTTYPGAINIVNYAVIIYSEDEFATALGIPTGVLPNGVYFFIHVNNEYVSKFVTSSKVIKIDGKYLDINEDTGLADVAFTGKYDDLNNKPIIYTNVIRYDTNQALTNSQKSRARTNIDVYSTTEVETKIANNLTEYAKTSEVETMITEAISSAIGGEY